MKKLIHAIALFCAFFGLIARACPTCNALVKIKDEPFFSDQFYHSMQKSEAHDALKSIDLSEYDVYDDDEDEEGSS